MADDDRCDQSRQDVTALLHRWGQGDARAADELLPLVYAEVRRQARSFLRSERDGHTPEPTALVPETYLHLVMQHVVMWAGRSQFRAIAAQAMRRVLIDYGRQRHAAKRGGRERERVTLDGLASADGGDGHRDVDAEVLHRSLEPLEALDARQAGIVEMRVLTGMSIDETATAFGISAATVKRDWATARLCLRRELKRSGA